MTGHPPIRSVLAAWFDTLTAGVPIEQFPIRFAAVATDLQSRTAMLIDSGPAGAAIQASVAVPGVPVPYRGGHLVDGGVSSLVPVRAARAMGADVVIGGGHPLPRPSRPGPERPGHHRPRDADPELPRRRPRDGRSRRADRTRRQGVGHGGEGRAGGGDGGGV